MKGLVSKLTVFIAVFTLFANVNLFAKDSKVDLATNITCGSCVSSIKTAFKDVDGVKDISANVETKVVTVSFDDEKISTDKIKSTITDLGYTATDKASSCSTDKKECSTKKEDSASGDKKSCKTDVKTASADKKCGDKENCCAGNKTADAKTK